MPTSNDMETQIRMQSVAVNSAARPLVMPMSGQSPGSRGSIPKYFPETFKDFFSMLTEDEDPNGAITNLLEDKHIPHPPSRGVVDHHPKMCEKPFCCHNGGHEQGGNASGTYLDSTLYSSGGGLTRTVSTKYYRRRPSQHNHLPSTDGTAKLLDSNISQNNFGRSNSFRLHRPVPSVASTYSSYLTYSPAVLVDRNACGQPEATCKHIQYCCLHQMNGNPPQGFQTSTANSTFSLNERSTKSTPRLLPLPLGGPPKASLDHQKFQSYVKDGINYSDDEKKSLINPQLGADRYGMSTGSEMAKNRDTLQQPPYSMLTKSHDQINQSRICEPPKVNTKKSRRSSCDYPDQPSVYGTSPSSGTDTLDSSISKTTTPRLSNRNDEFKQPSTVTYKHIAGSSFKATTNSTTKVNIITNPLLGQYPFESNLKSKMEEMVVTQQTGGTLKTISYTASANTSVGMKRPLLVNRRRSSSVTLPQLPIPVDRYIKSEDLESCSRDPNQSRSSGANESQGKCQPNLQKTPSKVKQEQRFGKQRQRMRTASMPAENRRPRLAEMRRSAIHCADVDIEYYRLRSFSITSHGICNLGDSMRSRRSRSINSVTSTGTSNSGRDRNNSNASQNELNVEAEAVGGSSSIPAYKVAMLGSSGVGKTALTYQFTTSEYICAYDLSLDDDYGQKTVSVLLNGTEIDLEVVDHPACEMSTEAFCATYSIDIFVVVYSIVDRKSFKEAERVLQYLRDNDCLLTRGAILVGNKTDLQRQREVPAQHGIKLAKEIRCKFIETSSGIDHNVDELLVGIVAQVKLNPHRLSRLTEKQKLMLASQQPSGAHFEPASNIAGADQEEDQASTKLGRKRQGGHSTGPLNSFHVHSLKQYVKTKQGKQKGKETTLTHHNLKEEDEDNKSTSTTSKSTESLCSSRSLGSLDHREISSCKTRIGSTNSTPIKRAARHHRRAKTDDEMDEIRKDEKHLGETCAGGVGVSKSAKSSPVKFCNRTKMFLTSFLRFRKSLRRRSSSSCSDFFVI